MCRYTLYRSGRQYPDSPSLYGFAGTSTVNFGVVSLCIQCIITTSLNNHKGERARKGGAAGTKSPRVKMKSWRQSQILDVIDHDAVASQEALRAKLKDRGIVATQATI